MIRNLLSEQTNARTYERTNVRTNNVISDFANEEENVN